VLEKVPEITFTVISDREKAIQFVVLFVFYFLCVCYSCPKMENRTACAWVRIWFVLDTDLWSYYSWKTKAGKRVYIASDLDWRSSLVCVLFHL